MATEPMGPVGEATRVLVVEDDRAMRGVVSRMLSRNGYETTVATDAAEARAALTGQPCDLAVCDVGLPGESGLDLLPDLVADDRPTLMISGLDDVELARKSLELGANGYLVKPFSETELIISISGALVQRRRESDTRVECVQLAERVSEKEAALHDATRLLEEFRSELRQSHMDALSRLWRAVEFRSEETGEHLERMSACCALLASRLGFDPDQADLIRLASPMHDVGKIAIPDGILMKPGPLSPEERGIMERHAEIGHEILSGSESELLELAATIALTHHERIDGTGYPSGLSADEIPIAGRIAAVADVFDALTSDRVYRRAMSVEEAVEVMSTERGRQFDARVLDCLLDSATELA